LTRVAGDKSDDGGCVADDGAADDGVADDVAGDEATPAARTSTTIAKGVILRVECAALRETDQP
jgi:hypothetical protein